jgi:uncharacterized membrane protein
MSQDTPEPIAEEQDVTVDAMAVSDGAYALMVADFSDVDAAWEAYELLTSIEDGVSVKIEAVVVVSKDQDGKLHVQKTTDHSTRRGLGWGLVGGVVLGVLFPPSVLASAAVLGAGGAAVGKARELHHKSDLAEQLQYSIDPGHSGIIAMVSDPGAVKIRKALDKANRIVESAVDQVAAKDIQATADALETQAQAEQN